MQNPMYEISAPGLYFAIDPQDQSDLRLVDAAGKDAARRVRRAMRFSLPAPQPQEGESDG